MKIQELISDGKVIPHKFGDLQFQRRKTPYYKNPDIEIPQYDPVLKRCWNAAYSEAENKQPFSHFETEPSARGSATHIVGITDGGQRVRCSTATQELAEVLVDAYNRGGFTDKSISRVELKEKSINEYAADEDGHIPPFRAYNVINNHRYLIDSFESRDEAIEFIQQNYVDDPRTKTFEWIVLDGAGEEVWSDSPAQRYDQYRSSRKIGFLPKNEK